MATWLNHLLTPSVHGVFLVCTRLWTDDLLSSFGSAHGGSVVHQVFFKVCRSITVAFLFQLRLPWRYVLSYFVLLFLQLVVVPLPIYLVLVSMVVAVLLRFGDFCVCSACAALALILVSITRKKRFWVCPADPAGRRALQTGAIEP